jgi:hypothetical protein
MGDHHLLGQHDAGGGDRRDTLACEKPRVGNVVPSQAPLLALWADACR